MGLDWKSYGGGYLAKSSHGLYLVYRNFDPEVGSTRWFAKYETTEMFEQSTSRALDLQRFDSLEQAQAFCEKHAEGYSGEV
jgi:hypothetical protein